METGKQCGGGGGGGGGLLDFLQLSIFASFYFLVSSFAFCFVELFVSMMLMLLKIIKRCVTI